MNQVWIYILGLGMGVGIAWLVLRSQWANPNKLPAVKDKSGSNALLNVNEERSGNKEEMKSKIILAIEMQKSVTNDSVQIFLGVSDATATRYLDELEKEGKIKQVGEIGRGVFYEKS